MKWKALSMGVLCLTLLGTATIPSQADEFSDAVRQQENQQQTEVQGPLTPLTFTSDKLTAEVGKLTTQIAAAAANLQVCQTEYRSAQARVTGSEQELMTKQAELKQRCLTLAERLRGVYIEGQVSYLEILAQSSDLNDFLSRLEYLGKLVANDQNIVRGIQEQKAQIALQKNQLTLQRDQAAKLQIQASAAKADLDSKKSRQQKVLAEVNKAKADALTDIEKLEAASNTVGQKIQQLQAAAKRGVIGSIKIWPLPGYDEISSPFGWRTNPITHKNGLHTGVDIPAPAGTAIEAAGAGVVLYTGNYGAYGNVVILDHGGGFATLYACQSKIAAKEGEKVKAGQIVGYVGSTGWGTGPQLHFEVREGGSPTDPLRFYN